MTINKVNFLVIRNAVQRHNAQLTGKPLASCNVSGFQNQVLKPTGRSKNRTAVAGQATELTALGLGICEALNAFPQPLFDAAALATRKAADYNEGVQRAEYFPLGLASYAQELHKKSLRLVSLAQKGKGKAVNESVRDTALDMINYACFLAEALDKGELK